MYELTKEYLQVVKLTGPGLAQGATGSLASQLTFSTWKGKAYLKKHAKPKQPRTPPQVAMRAIAAWLSTQWRNLPQADRNAWNDLARASRILAFNAYQAFNLHRWRNYQAPSTIPQTDTAGAWPNATFPTYTPVGRGIRIDFTVNVPNAGWAMPMFNTTASGVDQTWDRLIQLLPMHTAGPVSWTWHPLPPGTYWFRFNWSKVHGQMTDNPVNRSATVT